MKKIFFLTLIFAFTFFNIAEVCYADKIGESTGQYIKSSTITANVKTQLMADSDIKSLNISVKTLNGVVTLTGTVSNEMQKQKAELIASDVKGVKSVNNELIVRKNP